MLENVNLFANIPKKYLDELEKGATVRKYPKNTMLFMEGDDSGQLFIIKSGLVCVHTDDEEGRQLVLNYMGAGEYFGELSLIDKNPRSASVSTIEESCLISITRESFNAFLRDYPERHQDLMVALVDRIRALTGSVKGMALLDVYGRVSATLERLCGQGDDASKPRLTHQDIANMVGASREMVSRIMKELVVGGYIEVKSRKISILRAFPKNW